MPIYTWDFDRLSGRQEVTPTHEPIPFPLRIRTVCAWCPKEAPTVIVDHPLDDRGVSHGMCGRCRAQFLACRDQARS